MGSAQALEGAAVDIWDPAFIPYRVRMLRVGCGATVLVLAAFLVFRLLTGTTVIPGGVFVPLFSITAIAAAAAWLLPWDRLFLTQAGRWLLYAWSILDILLITALIALVPRESPVLFLPYVLTTLFFSLFYSRRAQLLLFSFTSVCYLSLFFAGELGASAADLVLQLGILSGVALVASFATKELTAGLLDATDSQASAEREKEKYASLLQAVSDLGEGVSISQLSTQRFTYVNDALCRILGYTREELLEMSYLDVLAPTDRAVVQELQEARVERDRTADYDRDFVGVRKDGTQVITEVVSKQLSDDFVVAVVRDVTERRQAQEELRGNEELFRAVSELASDFVYSARVEPGGTQTWEWATDGFTAVTGYEITDPAIHDGWASLVHPDDADRAAAAYRDLLTRDGRGRLEFRILTREGLEKWVDVSAETVPDEAKQRVTRIFGSAQDVTERRRAEAAVADRAEVLQAISELASDYVYAVRLLADGRLEWLWVTDGFHRVTGYELEDLEGAGAWLRLFDADQVDEATSSMSRLVTEIGSSIVLEHRLITKDGTAKEVVTHARSVAGAEEAGAIRIYGAVQDVSQRKRAETAMQHTLSLLRSTIESTWDGLLVVDLNGDVVVHNYRFTEMWGLSEGVLARGDDAAVAEAVRKVKDPDGFVAGIEKLYAEPERESYDVVELRDGRVFERYSRPQIEEGSIVGRVWSFRDVSERRENARRLEGSLSLLEATLEAVGEGILVMDKGGEIVTFNRRLAEMWGIPIEVLQKRNRAEALGIAASRVRDPEMFLSSIQGLWDGSLQEEVHLIELVDGRVLERVTRAGLAADIGLVISFRDVTQRRELEEQLRQAQKMEAVGRLAGGVAHDFNNLLTAILGYCELLKSDTALTKGVREDIDEIDKAAQMGADITAQLLDLSRRRVLRTEVLDVSEVVNAMHPMLRRLIGEDIGLETSTGEGRAQVEADRSQIEQVLLNLVVNARDAMTNGGEIHISTETVELSAEEAARGLRLDPGPHVLITVADNGSGIAPEVRGRIFEPFFTTHQSGGSTGLGLSTVYGIVSHYNGHIAVQTQPDIGTTFRVYLPAATEEAVPIARARAAERWLAGTETVLLVEDDDGIRRMTKRALESNGYRVLEAAGPTEALSLAELAAMQIDLLLTDVVMPGMSGRDLAMAVGKLLPEIKVLYMSGFTGEALARFGELAWNEDFLAKPFRTEGLFAKVREVLNRTEPHSATP